MTRDSAAVATLDDRRHSPLSAASNVVDGASSMMTNNITMSGSSSNGDIGGGDEGSSPKSSSAISTTTSCCGGSSSSSRSGSDDDDSAAVTKLPSVIDNNCSTNKNTQSLSLLHKDIANDNIVNKDSSSSSNSDDPVATSTSTNIGGRLTFYKDGKFIFQLAAHHQQNPFNNQSIAMSPCRWVPVQTVTQLHKNNIRSVGDWPQHQQNKTIWPYLASNSSSGNKSPQSIQQSQPQVRISERNQLYQNQTITSPPTGTINVATSTAVVMATTTNIVRRLPRKCSTNMLSDNSVNLHQNWQSQSHLRQISKCSQQHQQSFMMIATKEIKAQRHLLSLTKKRRRHSQKTTTELARESLLREQHQQQRPMVNLECVVRHLWCRRHTTDLFLRRQLSLNNNVDVTTSNTSDNTTTHSISRHIATTIDTVDSSCPNTVCGKRRSIFSLSPTPNISVIPAITVTSSNISSNINSNNASPQKKFRLGQQQQQQRQLVVDNNIVKKNVLPSANDHSITAILSSGVAGTKRISGCSVIPTVMDPEGCVITSTTTNAAVITPQKNMPLSPAPLSLLRTLLKSPSNESNSSPLTSASINGSGYRHISGSRKRSAVESTNISATLSSPIGVPSTNTIDNDHRTSMMPILPTVGSSIINDTNTTLTALHQLPNLHHSAAVVAAEQLAAAGYFNVLYHQAAMAAAMAYQTHTQLPQPLPKPQPQPPPPPPLLPSQFPTIGGSNNSWQRQLNQRLLILPSDVARGTGISTTTVPSSPSTIVAPYSSPLMAPAVNGNSSLPPATPSPPPLLLHPHPIHPHHLLFHHQHHQQQYPLVPAVQQQPLSYHQPKQHNIGVKKRTVKTMNATEQDGEIVDNNVAVVDDESSSSADCVPLNLSKDSTGSASTTTTVR